MRTYLCIDLKTFYASVECVERNLDPFHTNLVVADAARGAGAICLAISPKLKSMGVSNRCRLFEIPSNISYITAKPRMKRYMEYAAKIYRIYLNFVAKEDMHVYSIDEVFIDITNYLSLYQMTPEQLATMMIDEVHKHTGISAAVGIGTNLYLAKVALDITAKHTQSRIAFLNEKRYKQQLWHHRPLTDFWQIGKGTQRRLAAYGIYDMYSIAHTDTRLLYKEFGVLAEYLIDHANGFESTQIKDIKSYKKKQKSISNSQILFVDYTPKDALLILKEMVEQSVLELNEQHYVSDHIKVTIGYACEKKRHTYHDKAMKLPMKSNSYRYVIPYFEALYKSIVEPDQMIRKIGISFGDVVEASFRTYDIFSDPLSEEKEEQLQMTLLKIKHKYGKNAVVKGMNLLEHATGVRRNQLIGGHNAE